MINKKLNPKRFFISKDNSFTNMHLTQSTKTINLRKIEYKMMLRVVSILLERGVVIFGGYVRDKLIHDHHAEAFYEKSQSGKKYNDPLFDPDTVLRLMVPKDIDAFLKGGETEVAELLEDIRKEGFRVSTRVVRSIYFEEKNVKQQAVTVSTANDFGIPNVSVLMDLLHSTQDDIEPPFGRLDMLCNGFLLDKNGIRLSSQTGTRLDYLGAFARRKAENEIIEKILKLKTDFAVPAEEDTSMEKSSVKSRKLIAQRILRKQQAGWKVNQKVYTLQKGKSGKLCPRCEDPAFPFDKESNIVRLQCCGQKLHIGCFENHFLDEYTHCLVPKCANCQKAWNFH